MIIDALIDRHTRLTNLALSVLPDTSGLKQLATEGTLWETRAPQTIQELAARHCSIPASLELEPDETCVYLIMSIFVLPFH